MRNLLSSLFFILIFVGLGAMAFAAAPRGQEAAQPAAAPAAQVEVQEPAAPAATSKLNAIAMPLDVSSITYASDVMTYIDDANISAVWKWDATVSPPRWHEYNGGFFSDPDFEVPVGLPMMVDVDSGFSASSFAWVGDVPPSGTTTNTIYPNKLNFISIPLDQYASYGSPSAPNGMASDLMTDIGGIDAVWKWDATVSPPRWIEYNGGFFSDPDFEVYAGYPYMIDASASAPSQWP